MTDFSVNIGPRLLRQGGPAAQVLSAVVPDPPQAVRVLDNGTILKGIVQGRDISGMTIIATDKGTIKVAVSPAPPAGTPVTLEVRIVGDRLQVLILAAENALATSVRRPDNTQTAVGDDVAGNHGAQKVDASKATDAFAAARPTKAMVTAPVVAQLGTTVEAIVIRADPAVLRQILNNSGNPTAGATGATLSSVGVIDDPGFALSSPGQPQPNAISAGRSITSGLLSFLQPELRAQIELLFREFDGSTSPSMGKLPSAPIGSQALQDDTDRLTQSPGPLSRIPGDGHPAAATGQSASQPASAQPSQYANPVNQPARHEALSEWSVLPNGADIRVRIAMPPSPVPPGQTISSGTQIEAGSMSGRIVGHTPAGATIVATPFGAIVLKRDLALPAGTDILLMLELQSRSALAFASPTGVALNAQQLLLQASRGWPTLIDVIALLRGRGAAGTSSDPVQRLPQVGSRLAADLLRTMRIIRQGDVEGLLGSMSRQQIAALSGRDDIGGRLGSEMSQLSQFANQRGDSDWHCYFIPLWDDGALRQINLFYRRGGSGNAKNPSKEVNGSRFVIEIELSRMGAFQFDGLVRERRFDLVVRSRVALTPAIRHEIGELFQQAMEIGRYKGDISFQIVRDFPVSPLDDIARRDTVVSA